MDSATVKFRLLVYLIVTHKGVQYHSNVISNSQIFVENLHQFKALIAEQFNTSHNIDGQGCVTGNDITICNIMPLMESQPAIVTPEFRHGRS